MKWIEIIEIMPERAGLKTKHFEVRSKDGGIIGEIYWYGPWRKYCFFPDPNTVFEQQCLRDLAGFIEAETHKHRAKQMVTS